MIIVINLLIIFNNYGGFCWNSSEHKKCIYKATFDYERETLFINASENINYLYLLLLPYIVSFAIDNSTMYIK